MGLRELPRAYFSGYTYWNPSTMNNNDYQPTYDPATAMLNWSWLERHGMQDPAEFDAYATSLGIVPTANSQLDDNIHSDTPPAEWNFYGDNSCGFVQANQPVIEWPAKFSKPSTPLTVTGFTNDACTHITSGDPWIGQPLQLNVGIPEAKLVDVDPICPWSSQIFVDALDIGSAQARVGLTGRTAGRAHSRWVFFFRNLHLQPGIIIAGVAGSMWQLCLPTADLSFLDPSPSPASLAGQLRAALHQPGVEGLMVRLVTYHTIYFQGPAFTVHDAPDWRAITALYAEYAAQRSSYERGELREPPAADQPRLQQHRRLARAVDEQRHAHDGRRPHAPFAGERPRAGPEGQADAARAGRTRIRDRQRESGARQPRNDRSRLDDPRARPEHDQARLRHPPARARRRRRR